MKRRLDIERRLVRCYVKKEGALWIAVCIDLCLAAQAGNKVQSKANLKEQIDDYLMEAYSENTYTVPNRRAPLGQRATYYIASVLSQVQMGCFAVETYTVPWSIGITQMLGKTNDKHGKTT